LVPCGAFKLFGINEVTVAPKVQAFGELLELSATSEPETFPVYNPSVERTAPEAVQSAPALGVMFNLLSLIFVQVKVVADVVPVHVGVVGT
jgi:hypothetical protein